MYSQKQQTNEAEIAKKLIEILEGPMGISGFNPKAAAARKVLLDTLVSLQKVDLAPAPAVFSSNDYISGQFADIKQEFRANILGSVD